MRILITENQLEKIIKKYIAAQWLNNIVVKDGPNGCKNFYSDGTLKMVYIPSQKRMGYRPNSIYDIIRDVYKVFGVPSNGIRRQVEELIEEKYKLDVVKWVMM